MLGVNVLGGVDGLDGVGVVAGAERTGIGSGAGVGATGSASDGGGAGAAGVAVVVAAAATAAPAPAGASVLGGVPSDNPCLPRSAISRQRAFILSSSAVSDSQS